MKERTMQYKQKKTTQRKEEVIINKFSIKFVRRDLFVR